MAKIAMSHDPESTNGGRRPESRAGGLFRSPTKKASASGTDARQFREPDPIDSKRVYGRGSYRTSQLSNLLARYVRIRSELIASYHQLPEDGDTRREVEHAIACGQVLQTVKAELETRQPKLAVCANLLGLADRELIALYPRGILEWKVHSVQDDLRDLKDTPKVRLDRLEQLAQVDEPHRNDKWDAHSREAVKEAMRYLHEKAEGAYVEDDLQATRLRRVLGAMAMAWLSLVAAIPTVSTVQLSADGSEVVWPVWEFGSEWLDLAAAAIGLSVIGAVGGVISGMFALRDARAVLSEYRTSMLRLWLRPMTGAVAAVTLYLFISANVISGVEVANAGVYVVAAFFAGFSERYFLKQVHGMEGAQSVVGAAPSRASGGGSVPELPAGAARP